jgi:hypothetical protein
VRFERRRSPRAQVRVRRPRAAVRAEIARPRLLGSAAMKRWIPRVLAVLAVLFLAIQLVPAGRTNPPPTKSLEAPPDVLAILRRSCYDCHSNESRWPWYAYVAPVSWLVVHDVEDGRKELNFSHWGDLTQKKKDSAAGEIVEQVERGQMPLEKYLWMHGDAKVSPADLAVLTEWSESEL